MKLGFLFKALLGLVVFAGIILLITFWSRFTPFYKDCMKIHEGMTASEAESLLKSYIENGKYDVGRSGALSGFGLYVVSKSSGDYCNMAIENGVVTKFMPRFEP